MKLKDRILPEIATKLNNPEHLENVYLKYRSLITRETLQQYVKELSRGNNSTDSLTELNTGRTLPSRINEPLQTDNQSHQQG